jgi:uncharacterized protein (TIGR02271 family)
MSQQFEAGTPVYNATGNRIGRVSDRGVQGGYLLVRKGHIFHQTVYVPLNAIRRSDHRGVYLRLYKPYVKQPEEGSRRDGFPITPVKDENLLDATTNTMIWPPADSIPGDPDDLRVPLRQEQLFVQKQQREMSRVRVHKYVVEEPQTVTLDVTHEKVRVARVPITGHVDPGPNAFTEKLIEMPLMGEEVVVDKRAMVVEEVHLHKSHITEQHTINESIRKERLYVDGMDDPTQEMTRPDYLR